jgi:hypothetical protein
MGALEVPLGKPRRRTAWEDNIKVKVRKKSENVDWNELTQNMVQWRTLVSMVTKLRVSQNKTIS